MWRLSLILAVPATLAQNVPHIVSVLPAGNRDGTNVSGASVSGLRIDPAGKIPNSLGLDVSLTTGGAGRLKELL